MDLKKSILAPSQRAADVLRRRRVARPSRGLRTRQQDTSVPVAAGDRLGASLSGLVPFCWQALRALSRCLPAGPGRPSAVRKPSGR